jgi:hypothetical protein
MRFVARRNANRRRSKRNQVRGKATATRGNPSPVNPAGPTPEAGSRERGFFGNRSTRIWTVVAGVVAVAGLGLAIVQLWPQSSAPALMVSDFAVHDPASVDATASDPAASASPQGSTIKSNTIDVTFRNTGDQPALITSITATVLFAQQMKDCAPQGGGVTASANYTLEIPDTPPRTPFPVSRPTDFQVVAGGIDRFTITAGPSHQFLSSRVAWVYVLDLSVHQDRLGSPVHLGTAAFVARPGEGIAIAAEDTSDRACIEHNTKLINDAYALPAKRSAELNDVHSRYASIANRAAASASVPDTCITAAQDSVGPRLRSACFRYTDRQLVARFALSTPATPERTEILVRLRAPNGTTMRWVTWFRGSEWSVGFPEAEDPATLQYAGNGCGPCTSSGDSKNVTITYDTPPSLDAPTYDVSAELLDATDPANPKVLATLPMGSTISLPRSAG